MSWYEFLLFVHISAAAIWLGGAFTFQMYGMVVRRGGDTDEIARFAGRAPTRSVTRSQVSFRAFAGIARGLSSIAKP